jgi:transposase
MLLSEGQMSDYKGAALMIDALPPAKAMLGDRGYDADWFRNALTARGITPCIPSKTNRKVQIPHDKALYRQRHKIENMFGKLKDWRASTHATTDAPTPSSRPSQSLLPLSSGSDQ